MPEYYDWKDTGGRSRLQKGFALDKIKCSCGREILKDDTAEIHFYKSTGHCSGNHKEEYGKVNL